MFGFEMHLPAFAKPDVQRVSGIHQQPRLELTIEMQVVVFILSPSDGRLKFDCQEQGDERR